MELAEAPGRYNRPIRPAAQGELDLYAHAFAREDAAWSICSPDRAAVKVGVSLGWQDRLVSLQALVNDVGASPRPPLRSHFSERWLSQQRTSALLGL